MDSTAQNITPAVISRAEAKAAGLKRYFTGKPCPKGHVAERNVSSWGCVECMRADGAAWYVANTERRRATAAAWAAANAECARLVQHPSHSGAYEPGEGRKANPDRADGVAYGFARCLM